MELFVLKKLEYYSIYCKYYDMHKLINLEADEFYHILYKEFNSLFIMTGFPGPSYILFSNLKQAEIALDWINSRLIMSNLQKE